MKKTIYLAGGCFWGVEKYLSLIPGVIDTETGYANGKTENPSYEQVCRDRTGHAETVKVIYDADKLPLTELLQRFFEAIDPTSVNKQGNDVGVQYRTGIYYTQPEEKMVILAALKNLQAQFKSPVAIEAVPLDNYAPAEDYHQKFLDKNPSGYCHIPSKRFEQAKRPVTAGSGGLKKRLTPLQYKVTQENGTEPPFQNEYYNEFREGIYVDIVSGKPLFVSTDKLNQAADGPAFRSLSTAILYRNKPIQAMECAALKYAAKTAVRISGTFLMTAPRIRADYVIALTAQLYGLFQ